AAARHHGGGRPWRDRGKPGRPARARAIRAGSRTRRGAAHRPVRAAGARRGRCVGAGAGADGGDLVAPNAARHSREGGRGKFLAPTRMRWSTRVMVNKTKPFMLIDRKGRNTIHLRYGESSSDPKPFTLIVTPVYVAARINKEFLSHDDVMAYVDAHAE